MRLFELRDEDFLSNVTYQLTKDCEPWNRGWQIDKISAIFNNKVVGYLKMSYIPKEKMKMLYPSIFDFLYQVNGRTEMEPLATYDNKGNKISRDLKKIRKVLPSIIRNIRHDEELHKYTQYDFKTSSYPAVNALTDKQVLDLLHVLAKQLNKQFGKEFLKFRAYWTDNPVVDFINVNKDVERKGLGTELYIAGARYLKSQNMNLYASTLQSKMAEGAWNKFKEQGMTKVDSRGMYLVV